MARWRRRDSAPSTGDTPSSRSQRKRRVVCCGGYGRKQLTPHGKFIFIAVCLAVAIVSYFFCRSRRDWALLVCGLGFTLGADYFLILRHEHLHGVFLFCFVQVCYICRGLGTRLEFKRVCTLVIMAAVWIFAASFWLFTLVGLYAGLFALNIWVNYKFYVWPGRRIVLTGLVLFALCDINVLIFNLPQYLGYSQSLRAVFPLIWVFYLPSQFLLAISAIKMPQRLQRKV